LRRPRLYQSCGAIEEEEEGKEINATEVDAPLKLKKKK